jgi:hypothetical protein
MKFNKYLRRFIIYQGRKAAPTMTPVWAFFLAGWMLAICFIVIPYVPYWLDHNPLTRAVLAKQQWWPWVKILLPIAVGAFPLLWATRFICRGTQLCFPDELEAYESERELLF